MPLPAGSLLRRQQISVPLRRPHHGDGILATIWTLYAKRSVRKLIAGVEKRLDADAPLGFLLSGGLDSSLVSRHLRQAPRQENHTFAIGMDLDPIDLKYARGVADFIGAESAPRSSLTREQVLASLEEVVAMLGTYDITTIRASMGVPVFLPRPSTNRPTCVLMTGRDLLTSSSALQITRTCTPSPEAFQQEAKRSAWTGCICTTCSRRPAHRGPSSIEARVPFRDLDFVKQR